VPEFSCSEEARTGSKFCIFHDENYVKDHYVEYNVIKRFEEKVAESISKNKPLECIGYFIPPVEFAKLTGKGFSQPVYFNKATFYVTNFDHAKFSDEVRFTGATFSGASFNEVTFSNEVYFIRATFDLVNFIGAKFSSRANFFGATFTDWADFTGAKFFNEATFRYAKFSNEANFTGATFSKQAYFDEATFSSNKGKTLFNYITFEQPNKVTFAKSKLSKVSFRFSDITRIRFDEISWGGSDGRDEFTIIEEEWLKEQARREQKGEKQKVEEQVSLEDVLSVYRNLRENYEFRLRYEDAGKFFIKEMELKRKYRQLKPKGDNSLIPNIKYVLIQNGWLRRNFSLNGLYYHFSRYGESIWRPAAIGAMTIGLSTVLWLTQSDPTLQPSLSQNNPSSSNISNFTGTDYFTDSSHLLKAFERSVADFIPLLSLPSNIKVGVIDYIIKIVGGALTFGLLIIALRRKFERKYTR